MKNYDSIEQLVEEVRTGKTLLVCKKHNYTAARRRESGSLVPVPPEPRSCPECLRAYYYTDYCMTPPNMRKERTEELVEVVHRAVEFDKTGKFGADFELYDVKDPRFQVSFEKDGKPE